MMITPWLHLIQLGGGGANNILTSYIIYLYNNTRTLAHGTVTNDDDDVCLHEKFMR